MLVAQSVPRSTDTGTIYDQLVKVCLLVDQTCFKFIVVSYFGFVNFLLQYTPYAIVDWVQIR